MSKNTRVQIKLYPDFDEIIDRAPETRAVLTADAERAAQAARAAAPVATGRYRDGIGVESDATHVRLVGRDFKSHWIEWGTIRTRAHATLRNAAKRVASRLRED